MESNNKLSNLTTSIIKKWNEQGGVVRFINGDTLDCRKANLQSVSLKDALDHLDDWTTDVLMDLTEEEKILVHDPKWREGLKITPKKKGSK